MSRLTDELTDDEIEALSDMEKIEIEILGGKIPFKLYDTIEDGECVGFDVYFVDPDLDAVHVSFCCDGYAHIDTADYSYLTLDHSILANLASSSSEAKLRWHQLEQGSGQ